MTLGTRLHTWLHGKSVGEDEFGNRYFEAKSAPAGQKPKRWVMYKGEAEPSKVPPYWHGWLHYTTDNVPTEEDVKRYQWQKQHLPNLTGTEFAYLPSGHAKKGGQRTATAADYTPWVPD
jgi:NADH:ubiquinone oxidoreductase subunit